MIARSGRLTSTSSSFSFIHTRFHDWSKIAPSFSTITNASQEPILRVTGDKNYDGVKEFMLVSQDDSSTVNPSDLNKSNYKLSSLLVKRNVIFGAKVYQPDLNLVKACSPLVVQALNSASEYGDQPQALASLYGLSKWVCSCLQFAEENTTVDNPSATIAHLLRNQNKDESKMMLEAIKAIATQTPRPGKSIIGIGTYRDAQPGWEALAKEYAMVSNVDGESTLYRNFGGEIVCVEYLADTSPAYLKEAGGAVLRYFFL